MQEVGMGQAGMLPIVPEVALSTTRNRNIVYHNREEPKDVEVSGKCDRQHL